MRVDVLGPVEVRDDDRVVPLAGPRQRAVLTVLGLLGGTSVPVEQLADAVWDGNPPRTADHTLHNYVLRLRRLGLTITTDGAAYRLDTPTDVAAVQALLAGPTSAAALAGAAALVRGRPGAGIADGDLTRSRCAALAELVDVLLEDAAAAALDEAADAAQAARTIPRLRELADASPYRERRHELLMLGLYRAERQAEALDAFAHARAVLHRDLGVDPSPALRRMQQLVLSQDATLEPRRGRARADAVGVGGRALPGLATRFVGRAGEVAALTRAQLGSRLVTVVGPLGAGKSRIALQAAHAEPGPVWFVPLEGLAGPTAVAQAVLGVVSPSSAAADPADGLLDALGGSDGLLVLDAAENRVEEVARLATRLLAGCPRLRILLTSRQVLGLRDEATVPVGPLVAEDRRALLVDRATLADPSFRLEPADQDSADRLCALVDGLPLGIELVARHLRLLGVADLVGRVDADLDRWTAGAEDGGRGLVSAVAVAVERLAPERRALLARLAVLAAEADLDLARAVAAPERDEAWVFESLAALVDNSLVQVRSGPAGLRYALLLSVRRHCLAMLDDRSRADAEQAYVDAVLRRAARTSGELQSERRAECLLALDTDAPHLRSALAASLEGGDARRALHVAGALTDYWLARQLAEGMGWLQRLLAVSDVTGADRAGILLQMGHLAYWLTDFDLGVRLLTEARSLAAASPDPLLLGRILRRLGAIAAARDDLVAADVLLQESAQSLQLAGEPTEEAVSLLHLGSLLADQGRAEQALPVLVRAREALAAAHDPLREAQALSALTLVWWKAGDTDAALGTGEQALAMLRELGHRPTEAVVAYRLAAICRAAGRHDLAREHAESALELGRLTGTRTTTALAHDSLARLALDVGNGDEAAAHLVQALDLIEVESDRWVLADLLESTARLQGSRGRPVRRLLSRARALRELIDQPPAPAVAAELAALEAAAERRGEPAADPEPIDGAAALRTYARALAGAGEDPVAQAVPAAP